MIEHDMTGNGDENKDERNRASEARAADKPEMTPGADVPSAGEAAVPADGLDQNPAKAELLSRLKAKLGRKDAGDAYDVGEDLHQLRAFHLTQDEFLGEVERELGLHRTAAYDHLRIFREWPAIAAAGGHRGMGVREVLALIATPRLVRLPDPLEPDGLAEAEAALGPVSPGEPFEAGDDGDGEDDVVPVDYRPSRPGGVGAKAKNTKDHYLKKSRVLAAESALKVGLDNAARGVLEPWGIPKNETRVRYYSPGDLDVEDAFVILAPRTAICRRNVEGGAA